MVCKYQMIVVDSGFHKGGDRLVDSFDCDGTEAEYETIEISDTVTVLWEAGKTTLFNLSSEPFNFFYTIIFFLTLFNLSSVKEW